MKFVHFTKNGRSISVNKQRVVMIEEWREDSSKTVIYFMKGNDFKHSSLVVVDEEYAIVNSRLNTNFIPGSRSADRLEISEGGEE